MMARTTPTASIRPLRPDPSNQQLQVLSTPSQPITGVVLPTIAEQQPPVAVSTQDAEEAMATTTTTSSADALHPIPSTSSNTGSNVAMISPNNFSRQSGSDQGQAGRGRKRELDSSSSMAVFGQQQGSSSGASQALTLGDHQQSKRTRVVGPYVMTPASAVAAISQPTAAAQETEDVVPVTDDDVVAQQEAEGGVDDGDVALEIEEAEQGADEVVVDDDGMEQEGDDGIEGAGKTRH